MIELPLLRRLGLGFKLNVIIVFLSAVLVVAVFVVLQQNTGVFAEEIGEEQLQTEINIVQTQMQQLGDLLLADANLISSQNQVGNVVARNDLTTLEQIVNRAQSNFRLDDMDIVDTSGETLMDATLEEDSGEITFLQRALNGETVTGIIGEEEDGELKVSLGIALPLRNIRGSLSGAMFMSREINGAFLQDLAFSRDQVHLGLIYQDRIAVSYMNSVIHEDQMSADGEMAASDAMPEGDGIILELAPGIPLDQGAIERALDQDTVVSEGLVISSDGTRHAQAYVPLFDADGEADAVMLIQITLSSVFEFRDTVLTNTVASIGVVMILGVLLLAFGVRRLIVRPVSNLQQTAQLMSIGNYNERAEVYSEDQLGRLARNFNDMVDQIVKRDEELKDINASLEQRVEERTEELWKAVNEAKEANRLKDEFLAVMSHELRTPLNAMIGYLGIIKMTATLDETTGERVDRIRANAERLLGLINDILDISRIESGRMEFVPIDMPLREVIGEIRGQMEVLAKDKGLEFKVEIDPTLPPVIRMDEDAIYKVLINLLGNAFKFTHEGEVSLKVVNTGEEFEMRVKDSGIGIPAHMLDVVFDRFRQVDGSSKRNYGGTGLGLAIVKQICVTLGGNVRVESEPDQGSTFIVNLPLEEGELEAVEEGV